MIFEFNGRYYRRFPAPVIKGVLGSHTPIISLGPLSKSALKVYENLINGKFYRPHSDRTPKAMQELIDNGLVGTAGRVVTVERCYVPSHGYKPYQSEHYE